MRILFSNNNKKKNEKKKQSLIDYISNNKDEKSWSDQSHLLLHQRKKSLNMYLYKWNQIHNICNKSTMKIQQREGG